MPSAPKLIGFNHSETCVKDKSSIYADISVAVFPTKLCFLNLFDTKAVKLMCRAAADELIHLEVSFHNMN